MAKRTIAQLHDMQSRARRISQMVNDRARRECAAAGLDPNLLGCHPHNAMCSYRDGKPWAGVDYSKVRKTLWLLSKEFDANRIVDRWYSKHARELF